MLYILFENHKVKYELIQLSRIFFPDKDIKDLDSEDEYPGKGILIKSVLSEKGNENLAITELYMDGDLIDSRIEDISSIEIPGNPKSENRRLAIRKSFYNLLISKADIEVPWGILTGIRPMKIIHEFLNRKIEADHIREILKKEYRIDNVKIELLMDISDIQRPYISQIKANEFSLYVGIPFCPTTCAYCSFPSMNINRYKDYVDLYIEKLIFEIGEISQLMKDKTLDTVYIGGGTPTSIPPAYLERVIQAIYLSFNKTKFREFTVEAGRPDTISKEYLQMLRRNKVDRISINPQTMNDKTLRAVGRMHSSEDIIKSYYMAREIGFPVINMDIILGLPGEGIRELESSLGKIEELRPENLTVHTLSIKRGSIFKDNAGDFNLASQEIVSEMLAVCESFTRRMRLLPYYLYRQKQILGNFENVGYSKIKKESIYNILMMEEKQTIMGAGIGAVSKVFFPLTNRIERVPNFKDLGEYINRTEDLVIRKRRVLEVE